MFVRLFVFLEVRETQAQFCSLFTINSLCGGNSSVSVSLPESSPEGDVSGLVRVHRMARTGPQLKGPSF